MRGIPTPSVERFSLRDPRKRRIFFSYAKDWLLVIIMLVVFFAIDLIPPFRRQFSLTDTSLMHEYAVKERVPLYALLLCCLVAPIVLIALTSLVARSWHDLHHAVLGLFLALAITVMITDVLKISVGRPRPDFFERCQPKLDGSEPPFGLANYTICTVDPNRPDMIDGFKSFPSGHSSFSFCGLGYLAIYMAGKLHLFDERGHTYKSFVSIIPLLGATLIAISRIEDYRHHWSDCFVGAILGFSIAYFAYRQYFPPLVHEESHNAFRLRFNSDGSFNENAPPLQIDRGQEEATLGCGATDYHRNNKLENSRHCTASGSSSSTS
ncbi:hypothetical protein VTP01DRAFT_8690 [Rhizomucor pusillus]|uniref:uncharacterized protein n=1 Tax=Rhizomucor pusillus TaxID=4840 RepID=UPI00374461CF